MLLSTDALRLLNAYALHTKRSVQGQRQGTHRSIRKGHGVEFAEYRQYELGDNPRYIDWNLYARSDKLYIKRYVEEENVSIFIVIDGSQSLVHSSLRRKWEYAAKLASCISYIGLSSQDPVTICVLGHRESPTFAGGRAFYQADAFLTQIGESLNDNHTQLDLGAASRRIASRMSFPGVCIFISDFLYPLSQTAEAMSAFRSRNMAVHAVQILDSSDFNIAEEGSTLVDSESGEVVSVRTDSDVQDLFRTRLEQHNRSVREYCLSHQCPFVSTRLNQEIDGESPGSIEESCFETLNKMALFV